MRLFALAFWSCVLSMPSAAQADAEIVLLLKAPRVIGLDELREVAKKAYGSEFAVGKPTEIHQPYLVDAKDHRTIVFQDFVVILESHASPATLSEDAFEPIESASELAAARAHRACLRMRIAGVGASPERRAAAYDQLGRLAAALVGPDVVGIGASDYGSFEAPSRKLRRALTKGALMALEPRIPRSAVALLSAPRTWKAETLRKAVENAFGVQIPEKEGPEANGSVVVEGPIATVKVGEDTIALTLAPGRPTNAAGIEAGAGRKALVEHRMILHLLTFGRQGDDADRAAYSRLGKLLSELWGDDCLALSWKCSPTLITAISGIREQLRAKDPVVATLGGIPVVRDFDEGAMERAIAAARRRFAEAEAWFRAGKQISVKLPFATRHKGGHEHLWIQVTSITDETITGKVDNDPVDVEGLQIGASVTRPRAELTDWLYLDGETMHGGFSIEVLERGKSKPGTTTRKR